MMWEKEDVLIMSNIINHAFDEVYDVTMHLGLELRNKISSKFLDVIEKNRDTSYKVNIDYSKNLEEQELLQDTKTILGLIYRDFLCDEEKRAKLIAQDKKTFIEYQEELRKKYNPDNLFGKRVI